MDLNIEIGDFEKYKTVNSLVKRTNQEKPASKDVAALQKLLDESPEIWRFVGNTARRSIESIVRKTCRASRLVVECELKYLNDLRNDLGYETSSPLERILIEQVVLCQYRLAHLEDWHLTKTNESHVTETGIYWERRLTRAIASLALVRKTFAVTDIARSRIGNMPERELPRPRELKAVG